MKPLEFTMKLSPEKEMLYCDPFQKFDISEFLEEKGIKPQEKGEIEMIKEENNTRKEVKS